MIIVFDMNYQLQYNPSYTSTIHGTCEVQDFNYCMSFANAMQAKSKSVKCFIIRFSPNGTLDIFEKMNDIDILIQS